MLQAREMIKDSGVASLRPCDEVGNWPKAEFASCAAFFASLAEGDGKEQAQGNYLSSF